MTLLIWFLSAYGNHPKYATPLYGIGGFFFDADERIHYAGVAFLHFVHQIGLCSFSTSISFGALHERVNFKAMLIFCSFNIFIFVLPAHWMWDDLGFLKKIGAVDLGGSGVVHLTGGFSGKISCFYLFKKYLKYMYLPYYPYYHLCYQIMSSMHKSKNCRFKLI